MTHTRILTTCICVAVATVCAAQQRSLREVVVTGSRPIKETGITKTSFDSLALKENIALSMADVLSYI